MEKRIVSYEELQKKCILLADAIVHSGFKPNMIVSVTRGGLLSAYFLADLLGIRSIETINLSSYSDQQAGEIKDETKIKKDFSQFCCLIVDDLVDSGRTMNYILENYDFNPNYTKIAVLFTKPHAAKEPDYFVEKVPDDQWIVFPYER